MKPQYVLKNDLDLTFDDVTTPETENQAAVPTNLHPTEAMQEKFMQNCADVGIVRIVNT